MPPAPPSRRGKPRNCQLAIFLNLIIIVREFLTRSGMERKFGLRNRFPGKPLSFFRTNPARMNIPGGTASEPYMDYNILTVLGNASLIAKIVMALLVLLSILSWTVIIGKFFSLGRAGRKAEAGLKRFEEASDLRQALQTLGGDPSSPLYSVAQHGVREFNNGREAHVSADVVVETVRRALNQGVALEIDRMHNHLSLLATAANTAPFIGLFGTVWGIMTSFHAIGQMKSASLATVAPGISEALIATAVGLAVAVPASIAFNMFLGKLDSIETRLINFAGVFLNRIHSEVNRPHGDR